MKKPKINPLVVSDVQRPIFQKNSKIAITCPVCGGTGRVISGFYGNTETASTNGEECRSCGGKGYLIINQ